VQLVDCLDILHELNGSILGLQIVADPGDLVESGTSSFAVNIIIGT